MPFRPIRRALLSVHDKAGLVDFARGLAESTVNKSLVLERLLWRLAAAPAARVAGSNRE